MANELNEQGLQLGFQQRLGLALSAGSDFVSAISNYYSGQTSANSYNFQSWLSQTNANSLRPDAQNILTQANYQANQVREQGKKARGEQRAAMSASGFKVSSGSYQNIIAETDKNIQRNVNAIRTSAMSQYASTMYQADVQDIQANYYTAAAKQARRSATSSAIFSGITGAVKLGAMSYFS